MREVGSRYKYINLKYFFFKKKLSFMFKFLVEARKLLSLYQLDERGLKSDTSGRGPHMLFPMREEQSIRPLFSIDITCSEQ